MRCEGSSVQPRLAQQVEPGLSEPRAPRIAITNWERSSMTNFVVYLIGTLLVVAGLAYGASRLGISQVWIIAGALVILGIGMMGGIVKTRQKEPSS